MFADIEGAAGSNAHADDFYFGASPTLKGENPTARL